MDGVRAQPHGAQVRRGDGSLIFAAVQDQLTHAPTGADNRVMSTVRLGFSLGFMTGPLLGGVLGGVAGLRLTLIASTYAHPVAGGADDQADIPRAVPDRVVLLDDAGRNASRPIFCPS